MYDHFKNHFYITIHHHENSTHIVEDNRGEGGSDGARKGKLKAEGESAASARSTEVGLRGHSECSPSSRTHIPIIELKRMIS
jgi:hypothetical protein